jgi:hypothetical protein
VLQAIPLAQHLAIIILALLGYLILLLVKTG